jgi:hypothetical protein
LDDINDFVHKNRTKLKELNITTRDWVIIDQDGLDSSTCVLVHPAYDAEKRELTRDFEAARIPLVEA